MGRSVEYVRIILSLFPHSCQSRHKMTQDGMVLVVQQLKFQPFMNGANSFGRGTGSFYSYFDYFHLYFGVLNRVCRFDLRSDTMFTI